MKNFHIEYPDEGLREALIDKINNLTNRINPTNPLPYIKPSAQRTFCSRSWYSRRRGKQVSQRNHLATTK